MYMYMHYTVGWIGYCRTDLYIITCMYCVCICLYCFVSGSLMINNNAKLIVASILLRRYIPYTVHVL